MLNSCHPLVCAPTTCLRTQWAPLSRSYGGKLPSSFNIVRSSAWYSLPVHLCRFRVRSTRGLFPETPSLLPESNNRKQLAGFVTTHWPTNINVVPIDYAFRPRLRDRLTLRRLTLRRNPWTFGDSVFHTVCRYSCQHSHFCNLQELSRVSLRRRQNAPLPHPGISDQ